MRKLIFNNENQANRHQEDMDALIGGFPEDLALLRWVGLGIHASKEIGRALHYSQKHQNGKHNKWALNNVEGVDPPVGAELVDELPLDWWDE